MFFRSSPETRGLRPEVSAVDAVFSRGAQAPGSQPSSLKPTASSLPAREEEPVLPSAELFPAGKSSPSLDAIAEAFSHADRHRTREVLGLGRLCDRFLRASLAGVKPAARFKARAAAVASIHERLAESGERISTIGVNQIVAVYHVARLLGHAESLPYGVVRQFTPFAHRSPQNERWSLREEPRARELWQRAIAERLTAAAVAELLGVRGQGSGVRKPSSLKPQVSRLLAALAAMDHEPRRLALVELGRRLTDEDLAAIAAGRSEGERRAA